MDLTLEQRLLRFLAREEEDERRSAEDLRALSVEDRVLEGECIQDAVFEAAASDGFAFRVEENVSKFRPGDALLVGDGIDFDGGAWLVYGRCDARQHRLLLQRDRFARAEVDLRPGRRYCIDRRPLGLRGRLREVVRAGFADPELARVLEGAGDAPLDAGRFERARDRLAATGLDPSQVEAGAHAIGAERLGLIQGPPGTGKTRLLAEMLALLCGAGCRIALGAFTHRAVENALLAVRKVAPALPLIKLGHATTRDLALRRAGVRFVDPRHAQNLPPSGVVVAGTCFALARLAGRGGFHFTVFDEAAQIPIPHAIGGMLLSRRWILLGDHQQLPPVITADHADAEVTTSIFELLVRHHTCHMLRWSYRMNDAVCAVISEAFYDGRLQPAPEAASRRLPFEPGGVLDEVLDPERPAVLARVDHLQPGMRSLEEANLVADLVAELVSRHHVPPAQIAVVAPFRAQVRAIRSALQRKAVAGEADLSVDTVERIQGQEREVVLVSLAAGDPASLDRRASFFFSTNRLNVALSRARTKAILVASRGAFEALPSDPRSLRAASVFRRIYRMLPQTDLTPVYSS